MRCRTAGTRSMSRCLASSSLRVGPCPRATLCRSPLARCRSIPRTRQGVADSRQEPHHDHKWLFFSSSQYAVGAGCNQLRHETGSWTHSELIRAHAVRHAVAGRPPLYPFRFVDPVTGKWVRAVLRRETLRSQRNGAGMGNHSTAGNSERRRRFVQSVANLTA